MSHVGIPVWIAFWAGVVSFASPCTLPLFPSYLGYITGISYATLAGRTTVTPAIRARSFAHALCFCLGLSFLFITLGWGATAFGYTLARHQSEVRVIGGGLAIIMGLFMADVLKIEWLMRERRLTLPRLKPAGYIGSVLVGIAFAAGWTPCIGPVLATILSFTVSNPAVGTWYMVAYAIGFAVPFLVLALTLSSIRPLLKYTGLISRIGGWLLVLMGILLVFNGTSQITVWLVRLTHYQGY